MLTGWDGYMHSAGTAEITLASAAFSNAENAVSEDLTTATITTDSVFVTISEPAQDVTLSEYFDGNSTVDYGEDYIFSIKGDGIYYDYEIEATMNGEPVGVIDNGDGTYTIKNVIGELVITATRTPKKFTIEFATDTNVELPENDDTVYGEDYTFDMPEAEHFSTSITEAIYDNLDKDVEYSVENGVVNIKGTDIIDDIIITIDQVRADASLIDNKTYFPGYHMNKKHWYTICLDGSVSFDEICRRIVESYELAVK